VADQILIIRRINLKFAVLILLADLRLQKDGALRFLSPSASPTAIAS
jgi:hypothetical protein